MRKQAIAVVTNSTGTYLKTWDVFAFAGFDKQIYGGLGECVLQLPYIFDYAGLDVVLGNNVEIRISDEDTVATPDKQTKTIYSGYISLIERDIDGQAEGLKVHLLGDYTRLTLDILKNSSQTTLYTTATGLTITSGSNAAGDTGTIARAVIDRYRSETGSTARISYNTGSVPVTGNTAKYIFQQATYRDALDKLVQMSPIGTFYYVNENGVLTFGQPSTTPVHKFILGRSYFGMGKQAVLSISTTRTHAVSDSTDAARRYKTTTALPTATRPITSAHVSSAGVRTQTSRCSVRSSTTTRTRSGTILRK
jgi:hypothetical protein